MKNLNIQAFNGNNEAIAIPKIPIKCNISDIELTSEDLAIKISAYYNENDFLFIEIDKMDIAKKLDIDYNVGIINGIEDDEGRILDEDSQDMIEGYLVEDYSYSTEKILEFLKIIGVCI